MDRSKEKLRVAAVQMDVVPGDLDANLARHLERIAEAKKEGVDILVFPELSLTGYGIAARAWAVAVPDDHPVIEELAKAADGITVIVGFVEEGFAAQFFNACAVLRNGKVTFIHRKLNLPTYGAMDEGKHFAAGRYVESFPVGSPWIGACLICSDLWNPGLVHLAALHGATVLFVPTNSSRDPGHGRVAKPDCWDVFLRHYSLIYGLPIVFANRIGEEGAYEFWGGSRILDPHGQDIAAATGTEETMLVAELDFDAVKRARFELPTVRDSNLSLIHREIDRLVHEIGVPTVVRS
jgi:predicted amidohydrolase